MIDESTDPQTNYRGLDQDGPRGLAGFPSDTARLLTLVLTLLAVTLLAPTVVSAQTAVPTATTSAAPRTATPTLTAIRAKLVLAETLLIGGDFIGAAKLLSEIAAKEPGNPEALRRLKATLDAQAAATAAAVAPSTPPPPELYMSPTSPFSGILTTSLIGLFLLVGIDLVIILMSGGRFKDWLDRLHEIWWRPEEADAAPNTEGTSKGEDIKKHHLKARYRELSGQYEQLIEWIVVLDADLEAEWRPIANTGLS